VTLVAMCSLKGSPGVTTAALGLAAGWPSAEQPVVVECDPAGGDLLGRFRLETAPGLMDWSGDAAGRPQCWPNSAMTALTCAPHTRSAGPCADTAASPAIRQPSLPTTMSSTSVIRRGPLRWLPALPRFPCLPLPPHC